MSEPDEVFAALSVRLADEIEAALPAWVERCVVRIHDAWAGETPAEVRQQASDAGRDAVDEVLPVLRDLLSRDVDEQWTNPLQIVRSAARYPTAVLAASGVGAVVRDEFAERTAPDDVYDLEPAGFADLGGELHEIGLAWGAAKARAHLARRREAR